MHEIEHRDFPWGSITVVDTEDICAYLAGKHSSFPAGGRIYHKGVDVTPRDEHGIKALQELSGEFSVAVAPGGPTFVPMLVMTAVSIGIGYLLRPDIDIEAQDVSKWDAGSPTNSPGRISNKARVGKRVPDLYGYVRHTPDLLAPIITRYEAGQRVEYAYLSVGRGRMSDVRFDIFDGDVDVSTLLGYSAAVWPPNSTINSTPQHTVGNAIDMDQIQTVAWRILDAGKYEAIPPANSHTMPTNTDGPVSQLRPLAKSPSGFWELGHIYSMQGDGSYGYTYNVDYDFAVQYPAGSKISIENVDVTTAGHDIPTGIEGEYDVLQSSGGYATLDIPDSKLAAWDAISAADAPFVSMEIVQLSAPITYTVPDAVRFIDVTLEAPGGLYFAGNDHPVERTFQVTTYWTRISDGAGPNIVSMSAMVTGNTRTAVGTTVRVPAPVVMNEEACSVEVVIVSTSAFNDSTSYWTEEAVGRVDLKSISAALERVETSAAEVTTMMVRVPSNPVTAQLRSRGITVETSKQLASVDDPGELLDEPYNDTWSEIVADMALDQRIGRMDIANVPWRDWADVRNDMRTYLGSDGEMMHFAHVFDGDNTTFEDMLGTVSLAMGMVAYRVGSAIQFRHVRPHTTPTLLFNCRNKLPGSETRTVRFGSEDNIDQAAASYTDREDGTYEKREVITPDVGTETVPVQVGAVGLQYEKQAEMLACRRYYQAIYEYIFVEFSATEEAALLLPGDLIMNVDSTRAAVIEGELTGVSGTTLTLGNNIQLRDDAGDTTDFVVFLQMPDGTVITRDVVSPVHTVVNTLTIDSALPASSTDVSNFARTLFYIVEDTTNAGSTDLFIVDKVSPERKGTYTVSAHNYDERIFQDDPTA